jgi:lipopolysaccharide assembly protein A
MLRLLRYLGLVLLALAIVTRAPVTLHALPPDMGLFLGFSWAVELPLFLVIFGGIAVGLLIGFFWEWARESKHRSAASTRSREVARLEREVARLREAKAEPEDEVLALLENKRKAG